MDIIGIIVEYNPFHNGHIYHINKIKELYPDSIIIATISSCFTQRGDISIMNKWDKSKIALDVGCDIVIEIPFKYSCQSADIFAKYSIDILNDIGVNKIVFGSESCDICKLKEISRCSLSSEFDGSLKKYIDSGISYPKAIAMSTKDILGYEINSSNDILGISYIKEIIKNNFNIEPIAIKRTNNFNGTTTTGSISSASSIREELRNNKVISSYVPKYTCNHVYDIKKMEKNYFNILKYKILSDENLSAYNFVDEGLDNKLIKCIKESDDLDELIKKIKSKRYTYVRIKRMLTHIVCNSKKNMNYDNYYIRILGFSKNGKKYLSSIRGKNNIPIITNYNRIFDDEYKITCIYSLIVEDSTLVDKEYKNKPIQL